jgi:methylmalonyl-CoA mutase cobalamin-binding domain/chain
MWQRPTEGRPDVKKAASDRKGRINMEEELKKAFLGMRRQEVVDLVKDALESGVDPLDILMVCREAMEAVGKHFETGEFFLSELIYSAEVFKAVSAMLEPYLLARRVEEDSKGIIVFGTPKGDIHDLGKNIVATMMKAQGFTVHDLGVDVPPEKLVQEVHKTGAPILALSALITPAFVSMIEAITLLEEKGLRKKTFVIIGGGVTTEFSRKEVGADAQTLDPAEAIRMCTEYIEGKRNSDQ